MESIPSRSKSSSGWIERPWAMMLALTKAVRAAATASGSIPACGVPVVIRDYNVQLSGSRGQRARHCRRIGPPVGRPARVLGIVAIVLTALAAGGIAVSAHWISAPPLDVALGAAPASPALRFGVDTFAFANENRTIYRGKPDLYPGWCFVMARAVTQFQRFARFDPAAPRLTADEYSARVREITARPPWREPLPPDARIV